MQSAKAWVELLRSQPIPKQEVFQKHIDAATISSLCDCGCNSFTLSIPNSTVLPELQSGNGLYSELAFNTNQDDNLNILIFTDNRGYLGSVDVTYGASNHAPIPDNLVVKDLIYVLGSNESGI